MKALTQILNENDLISLLQAGGDIINRFNNSNGVIEFTDGATLKNILGRGSQGVPIKLSDGRVLKITSSMRETETSSALVNHNCPNIIPIHKVAWLVLKEKNIKESIDDPWEITSGRVGLILEDEIKNDEVKMNEILINVDMLEMNRGNFGNMEQYSLAVDTINRIAYQFKNKVDLIDGKVRYGKHYYLDRDLVWLKESKEFLRAMYVAFSYLEQHGIRWTDVHGGNIGENIQTGEYVIFDFGLSSSPMTKPIPYLKENIG